MRKKTQTIDPSQHLWSDNGFHVEIWCLKWCFRYLASDSNWLNNNRISYALCHWMNWMQIPGECLILVTPSDWFFNGIRLFYFSEMDISILYVMWLVKGLLVRNHHEIHYLEFGKEIFWKNKRACPSLGISFLGTSESLSKFMYVMRIAWCGYIK